MAYLDNNGVLYLWGKIKAHVSSAVAGFYTKPSGGIPASDLASAVQTSLGKADTALQEHQDISRKVDKVDGKGLSTNDYTTAEKNKLQGIEAGADANPVFRRSATETAGKVTGFDVVTDGAYQGINIVYGAGSTHFLIDSSGFAKAMQQIASTYALKSDIASMYKYQGSVATVSDLPSSGNTTGDVYNVESTGMNYAWNGTAWDALGESFQITAITNAEIDTICT